MSTKNRVGKASTTYRLDSKPYTDKVRRATEMAEATLDRYGQPTLSLAELRATLDRQLRGTSLTELIIKEREAGL